MILHYSHPLLLWAVTLHGLPILSTAQLTSKNLEHLLSVLADFEMLSSQASHICQAVQTSCEGHNWSLPPKFPCLSPVSADNTEVTEQLLLLPHPFSPSAGASTHPASFPHSHHSIRHLRYIPIKVSADGQRVSSLTPPSPSPLLYSCVEELSSLVNFFFFFSSFKLSLSPIESEPLLLP